ncbi:myosin-4-like protein [Lates japonicus]|uniref:Myosin-4-like protein n=1 Tax=Lates japonicus TaxID=270547 RepID=A0AAD3N9L2_LATJO|nr:myosin-4-like protein [Lates japonicus]
MEASLARRAEEMAQNALAEKKETTSLKEKLTQVQEDLDKSLRQWEEEKTLLLAQKNEESSSLMQKISQAKEELKKKDSSGGRNTCLLESVNVMKQALQEKEEQRQKHEEELSRRLAQLEDLVSNMPEQKPKRRSLGRRFLQIFRRSRGTQPDSDLPANITE